MSQKHKQLPEVLKPLEDYYLSRVESIKREYLKQNISYDKAQDQIDLLIPNIISEVARKLQKHQNIAQV